MKLFTVALSLIAVLAISACTPGNAVDGHRADSTFNRSLRK